MVLSKVHDFSISKAFLHTEALVQSTFLYFPYLFIQNYLNYQYFYLRFIVFKKTYP
jgi:hypothetical protein